MMFQSNSSGRDSTEGSQELILDEHVECGCRCNTHVALQCADRFNGDTCQCECDLQRFGEENLICESQAGTYWDNRECACQGKGVVSRGVGQTEPRECGGRGQRTLQEILGINNPWYMSSPAMAYFFLGCFITLSIFLYLSTCYYRKRFYLFKKTKRQPDKSKCKIYDQQRTNERQHRKRNEVKKTSVATVQVFPQH